MPRAARLRRLPLARSLAAFARAEGGVVAVEFALVVPVLTVLWLGFAGLGMGMRTAAQVNEAADVMGDLTAQASRVTPTSLSAVMNAAQAIITELPPSDVKLSIVGVNVSDRGNATVAWAVARNGASRPRKNSSYDHEIDLRLRPRGGGDRFLIVSFAETQYTPPFGSGITGPIELNYKRYYTPRLGGDVECSGC